MKVYFATRMGHIVSPERNQVKKMTWKIQPTCSVIQQALGGVTSLILEKWLRGGGGGGDASFSSQPFQWDA